MKPKHEFHEIGIVSVISTGIETFGTQVNKPKWKWREKLNEIVLNSKM